MCSVASLVLYAMDDIQSIGSSLGYKSSSRSGHSRYSRSSATSSSNLNVCIGSPVSNKLSSGINDMYIESKTDMLEIIEEGLQLKLEIKNIKEQFLSLLQNYDNYSSTTMPPPLSVAALPAQEKGLSAARARVRALYEARKTRMQIRRACSSAASTHCVTPKPSKRARSLREQDKENTPMNFQNLIGRSKRSSSSSTCSSYMSSRHSKGTSQLLTPIKEESQNILSMRRRSQPVPVSNFTSPAMSDIEGDYVTLRSPMQYNYINTPAMHAPHQTLRSTNVTPCRTANDTSIWVNSTDGLPHRQDVTAELSAYNYTRSPTCLNGSRMSPRKYASSDVISELYTNKSIRDISQITEVDTSVREQASCTDISEAAVFHSTFNYPLHSTLAYPLNSTIDFCDESPPKSSDAPSDDNDLRSSDARTTISEPSGVLRNNMLTRQNSQSPRALDDSWMNIKSLQKVEKKLPRNSSRGSNRSRSERSLLRTPKSRRSAPAVSTPQLCKEHGVHPTFGGPCIFANDDSLPVSSTESSTDEDLIGIGTGRDLYGNAKHTLDRLTYVETDCDSSYLSECMDEGCNFNQGLSEAEEYTATYDARNGRMKMLKRQTGQTRLESGQLRPAVGLSESDFLDTTHNFTRVINADATQKHFSLVANRSSLPDLSAFSTSTSDEDMDSTLRDTILKPSIESSVKKILASPLELNNTLVNDVPESGDQQRPLSVATVDTSPESNNGGMVVPVNSPNVTDSTGSSSKQNTDSYDYVEVPIPQAKQAKLRLPVTRQLSRPSPRRRSHQARSTCSARRHSDSSRARRHSDTNSMPGARPLSIHARRCLCYHHDDSGFSTPASVPRNNHSHHITISDEQGNQHNVVQHAAVSRTVSRERKKALKKKIKNFSNHVQSTGNLHIRTLGHF